MLCNAVCTLELSCSSSRCVPNILDTSFNSLGSPALITWKFTLSSLFCLCFPNALVWLPTTTHCCSYTVSSVVGTDDPPDPTTQGSKEQVQEDSFWCQPLACRANMSEGTDPVCVLPESCLCKSPPRHLVCRWHREVASSWLSTQRRMSFSSRVKFSDAQAARLVRGDGDGLLKSSNCQAF